MDNQPIADATLNRCAAVAEIAHQMQEKGPLGRTALQKLVYILQVWKKVPAGYTYRMYHFGPFSGMLLSDLDYMAAAGAIEITRREDAFLIAPGSATEQILSRAADFLSEHREQIREVVETFGHYSARDLELRATAVFVARQLAGGKTPVTAEEVTAETVRLKPQFHPNETRHALGQLARLGVVSLS